SATPVAKLYEPSWVSVLTWSVQATLAMWVAGRLSQVVVEEAPGKIEGYIYGWPIVVVIIVTISSSFWTYDFVEYLLIRTVYGTAEWNNGLRVADKFGHLSDGRELSGLQNTVLHLGSFLLSVPFFIGSAFGAGYVNKRLHGKRRPVLERLP